MHVFYPENGFIHIFFASEDDLYYTEHPLSMSFKKYMVYVLKKQQEKIIDYVYFLDSSLNVTAGDKKSREKIDSIKSNWLWGGDSSTESFKKLESIMKRGNTAVVVRASDLSRIVNDADDKKAKLFGNLKDVRTSNFLIVVFDVRGESISNIITPDNNRKSIFTAPQFADNFSELMDFSEDNYRFPIERMLEVGHMRRSIVFLNELKYDDILNITRYCIMNNYPPTSTYYSMSEWIAAVVFAWYNSTLFRCCCDFGFEENPLRKRKIIEQNLSQPNNFNRVLNAAINLKLEYSNDNQMSFSENYDSDSENIKLFLSKLEIDDTEAVHNIFSNASNTYVVSMRDIIHKAFMNKSLDERNFDISLFDKCAPVLVPFAEAERQLKRLLEKNIPNKNIENALNECIEEVRTTFKLEGEEFYISEMLEIGSGLYAVLFNKAVKKYYEFTEEYRYGNEVTETKVFKTQKYCAVITLLLKAIKVTAKKHCERNSKDEAEVQQLEHQIDIISKSIDTAARAGDLEKYSGMLIQSMNELG